MIVIQSEVRKLLHKLNMTEYHTDKFRDVMRELFSNFYTKPLLYCDYGDHIYAGNKIFINLEAVILDGSKVTIRARSVVTKDIPLDSLEVDNLAKAIRKLYRGEDLSKVETF